MASPPTLRLELTVNSDKHELELAADTATFGELQKRVAEVSFVPPENQKVFVNGKRMDKEASADTLLSSYERFAPTLAKAAKAGRPPVLKLKVLGSTAETLAAAKQVSVAATERDLVCAGGLSWRPCTRCYSTGTTYDHPHPALTSPFLLPDWSPCCL
jgi:hypothetical protein